MPISEENKALYPDNWKEIRARIQKRAGDRCEQCDVQNYAWGYRSNDGTFFQEDGERHIPESALQSKMIRIVCTTAHLDHDPTNNKDWNLAFLCQRCHNRYDQLHRQANAAATRKAKRRARDDARGQGRLLIFAVAALSLLSCRSPFTVKRQVPAYCPEKCCTGKWADGITASGTDAYQRGIASKWLPFGSMVKVRGQWLRVDDRGPNEIEVRFPTHEEARQWGVPWEWVEIQNSKKGAEE